MGLIRAALAVAVLSAPLVAPGNDAGRNPSGKQAGQQLEQVIAHYQNGELEQAWDAYRTFFDNPSNRNVDIRAFAHCFYLPKCPSLGALAYILGKSEAEAGAFRSFCPDWSDAAGKGNASADELAKIYEEIYAFRTAALDGSCAEWVERNAAMFEPRPEPAWRPSQIMPIVLGEGSIPYAEAEIFQTRITGALDTGASLSLLDDRWADASPGAFEFIQKIPVRFIGSMGAASLGRVGDIRLGNEIFSRPVVILGHEYSVENGERTRVAAEEANIFGMNLILQYESACFDWDRNKLHLGELGFCKNGVTPYRNWLSGSQGIAVEARVSPNGRHEVKIDTGSYKTWCSEWFMEQTAPHHSFSFGSDNTLSAQCSYDPEILFRNSEKGAEANSYHVLLGMDTLRQFAAFGWELNPLKVYFVPKSPVSASPGPFSPQLQSPGRQDSPPTTP